MTDLARNFIFRAVESQPRPASATSRFSNPSFWWCAAWAIAALLHVTQVIWTSGGREAPGDLGDGRFNQLILEHGYQSLRGVYDWISPSQFFPQKGTLTYSDTHGGTLPIYAALRAGGFSMENALQSWFVVVAALNIFAGTRLFAALGISPAIRGPLVFAATASAVWVWLAGVHMQMLPFFPALFMWTQGVLWLRDRHSVRLLAAAGWFAWQFAAAPYVTFFAGVITAAVAVVFAPAYFFARPREILPPPGAPAPSKIAAGLIAVAGGTLAFASARIYLRSAEMGVTRAMNELITLAPIPTQWFVAPPVHRWWPTGPATLLDNEWLAGFLPFILLPVALVLGWKRRREPDGIWILALGLGAVATMAFFTKWTADGASAWLLVAEHVPSLRAFRACGRIAPLLVIAIVAAGGLLLTHWQSLATRRGIRWIPGAIAVLIAVESLAHNQPGMDLAVAKFRADAVIAAWRQAGDRPVLAYAFGYVNQPPPWQHLDAWSAALRLKRSTLNGYTGGVPSSVWSFYWNPTVENARATLAQNKLNPAEVSIVENLAAADAAKIGLARVAHLPVSFLDGFQLQPSAWTLFGPLERFEVNGAVMYQFTPPSTVEFELPDHVTSLEFNQAMRAGSYNGAGHSDGVGVTWSIRSQGEKENVLAREFLDPGSHPEQRGILHRKIALPPAAKRVLILRTDVGEKADGRWDWPLFSEFKIQ